MLLIIWRITKIADFSYLFIKQNIKKLSNVIDISQNPLGTLISWKLR